MPLKNWPYLGFGHGQWYWILKVYLDTLYETWFTMIYIATGWCLHAGIVWFYVDKFDLFLTFFHRVIRAALEKIKEIKKIQEKSNKQKNGMFIVFDII